MRSTLLRHTIAGFFSSLLELKTILDWMNTSSGQICKQDNPSGYLNVKIHAVLHQQDAGQKSKAQAATAVQQTAGMEAAHAEPKAAAETKKDIAVEQEKRKTAVIKEAIKPPPPPPVFGPGRVQ